MDDRLTFRIRTDISAAIRATASETGISVSRLIRDSVIAQIGLEKLQRERGAAGAETRAP